MAGSLRDRLTVVAAMVGMGSREFGAGWAEGMTRWRRHYTIRDRGLEIVAVDESRFPAGSVARAASQAAVAYQRERNEQ